MKKWQSNKTVKLLPALALTFGVLAPLPASASIVEECLDDQCTITFGYTGQIETLTIPENATNVRFEAFGAQGGKTGGGGGKVTGTFTEVPTILYITVGGAGLSKAAAPGGFNGGGTAGGSSGVEGSGGGASDIRTGYSLSSRIVVAGGGGGRGSGLGTGGGAGGGLVGGSGKTGQGSGGTGGSQTAGGLGGASNGHGTSATRGVLGVGGTGGYGPLHGGGGGGGGYFGGGGGGADSNSCCTDAGGGGGGSSYTDAAFVSDVIHTQGVRSGAGTVTIRYQLLVVSPPTPPTEEPTPPVEEPAAPPTEQPTPPVEEPAAPPTEQPTPPVEEPAAPPTEQPTPPVEETTPPVEEPAAPPTEQPTPPVEEQAPPSVEEPASPNPSEPESVISDPSDSEQPVSGQPEPTEAPAQESDSLDAVFTPELVEELTAPIATVELVSEAGKTRIYETTFVSDNSVTKPVPQLQDEILQQPSNLTQAAQTVVVPAENNQTLWSSFSLFAGLLGIGTFALIAGLVLARRGVPGAIAS